MELVLNDLVSKVEFNKKRLEDFNDKFTEMYNASMADQAKTYKHVVTAQD